MTTRRTPGVRSKVFQRVDKLDRQLFLGFVRTHILFHASEAPICGVEITDELERHGYHLSPGMLYPTLHGLTAARYLRCHSTIKNGRVRKYYRITPHGQRALGEAKKRLRELVKEVLEGDAR